MGYRQYIFKVEKAKADEVRGLNFEELEHKFAHVAEFDGSFSILDMVEDLQKQRVYELGSDFDMETLFAITDDIFFTRKEVAKGYKEYDLRILNENAFLTIAKHFEAKVKRHFELLLTPPTLYGDYEERPYEPNPITPAKEGSHPKNLKVDDVLANEYITKRIIEDFLNKKRMWVLDLVLNTNQDSDYLTKSTLYEYCVFEMLRLHKTADFENYYYVIYGY